LALHKSQLGLQSWLWQVPCTLTLRTSLPPPLNDDDDYDDVFCDDDHDDDDHDGGVSHGSLSLPSRLQALHRSRLELQSWRWLALCMLALHTSRLVLLPPCKLQMPLRKSLGLLQLLRHPPNNSQREALCTLALHKSLMELQLWWWPALCTLALHKSQLGLQSWRGQALCTLTLHTSLPLPEPLR